VTFTIVGLVAQLVDGSLGMAYGATSATVLVASGYSPAIASASIHLAEVGTTFASGLAHWRFGNVDWRVVRRMALPGAVAAFAGATVLSSVDGDVIKPWTATILLGLGVVVLLRFGVGIGAQRRRRRELSAPAAGGLGLVAGFIDAIGGGGWGPVATPTLMTATDMEPRRVIGSVDTSEFVVALGASVGFLLGLGRAGVDLTLVGALLVGGLVAAPVAAWLVRHLPTHLLGVGVGGLLVLTNARTLVGELAIDGVYVYPVIVVVWAGLVVHTVRRHAAQRGDQASPSVKSSATSSGSDPASRSASVTASSTDRSAARTATQSEASVSTLPS
jgi:uncharacterized membrane protein YfcA